VVHSERHVGWKSVFGVGFRPRDLHVGPPRRLEPI
jgi:hypothetical protein